MRMMKRENQQFIYFMKVRFGAINKRKKDSYWIKEINLD